MAEEGSSVVEEEVNVPGTEGDEGAVAVDYPAVVEKLEQQLWLSDQSVQVLTQTFARFQTHDSSTQKKIEALEGQIKELRLKLTLAEGMVSVNGECEYSQK
jgi:hypothetical protein